MALDILAPIAEFLSNVAFAIQNWKRQGVFPTISVFVAALVFLLLGGISALAASALAPPWHPLAIVLVVSVGSIAIPFGAERAGLKLGFVLDKVRAVVFAVFAGVGAFGALYAANAL